MSTPEQVAARLDWADEKARTMLEAQPWHDRSLLPIIASALREAKALGLGEGFAATSATNRSLQACIAGEARLRAALCEIGWANRLTDDERIGIARAALSAANK